MSDRSSFVNKIVWLIPGYRRFSNIIWFGLLFFAGFGFLLKGASSYFNSPIFPLFDENVLNYVPQGMIMTFYGALGIILSLFILFGIILNVGGGYNEFNKSLNLIRIARNGWAGRNKSILLTYSLDDIEKIEVFIREGLNPKRVIYLLTKDKRKLPLTPIGQPMALAEIEDKAFRLAEYLNINLFFNVKLNVSMTDI